MTRTLPVALALTLSACSLLAATESEPLTLAAAADLVLARHPALAGASARATPAHGAALR